MSPEGALDVAGVGLISWTVSGPFVFSPPKWVWKAEAVVEGDVLLRVACKSERDAKLAVLGALMDHVQMVIDGARGARAALARLESDVKHEP